MKKLLQYFGGKTKVSSQIVDYLESVRKENQVYIEPFVGGGIICSKMSGERKAYDFNEYLIEMYKAVQGGYKLPSSVSEEEYKYIREHKDEDKALTGFVGFGCSFAGKWFGGYARDKRKKCDFACSSKLTLLKKMSTMMDVEFRRANYKEFHFTDCLIYCDPPYLDTTQAYGTGNFDTEEFWSVMRKWSESNDVYISEYVAPEDFKCVLKMPTKIDIRNKNNQMEKRIEKLFIYKGGV